MTPFNKLQNPDGIFHRFNNKVAKVGNYKVIIDDNGEVADVRDNNNFKVSLDEMKSVTDKYNAYPKRSC